MFFYRNGQLVRQRSKWVHGAPAAGAAAGQLSRTFARPRDARRKRIWPS